MNAEKFTQKTIQTINDAQNLAHEKQNQTLMPEHLLAALYRRTAALSERLFTESAKKPATPTLLVRS